MTSGERMVWAASFSARLAIGGSAVDAARTARRDVEQIRNAHSQAARPPYGQLPLDVSDVEMLDDMLTPDEDRVRSVSQAVIDEDE